MDEYETRIREKVYASNILTQGEWVYLVGLFLTAKEHDELAVENERLRAAVERLGEIGDVCTFAELGTICSNCRCERAAHQEGSR